MITGKEIFGFIKEKIISRYNGNIYLTTANDSMHTLIFWEPISSYFNKEYNLLLDADEFPILECSLPNGNYFLMSTQKMISFYKETLYELPYKKYWWGDKKIMTQNLPFYEGKTKIFKYYSLDKVEFWYEIDSLQPADAAHCCILYYMRLKIYPKSIDFIDFPDSIDTDL